MAVTKRSVKGSELTQAEMDANWDELSGLLTRLSTFVASQTPGANNIPVLDALSRLLIGSKVAISPGIATYGPSFGDKDTPYTQIYSASGSYLCCNCQQNGTNWLSIAAGTAFIVAATQNNGGGAILYTANPVPTAAGEVITWSAAQIMTVPAADTWTNITPLSGMGLYAWETPAYRKCAATGNFQAKGCLQNTSGSPIAATSNIFFVPAGFRPASTLVRMCPYSANGASWTGELMLYYNSANGYMVNQFEIPNQAVVDLGALSWFIAA